MKEFLSENKIEYKENDLSKNPEKEAEMKKITGNIIVPAILLKKPALLGLRKKRKVFIGFEINQDEIKREIFGS
ncbi:glutaredoxin family protein [Vulcanibacillus modesticaldus]|uniref:glutaredoxin family protein n=1 Tax=Vulcanibacillus modesticaldus TaxID=337097 RepID=UPI002480903E|nr:glutaredoxin domain-containing protein [Vulcanibacillus modesticaldus]